MVPFRIQNIIVLNRLVVCMWPTAVMAKVPVFVSILPQRYFVEQIGGAHVVRVGPLAMDWAENLRNVAEKFRQAME
jgi:hypothetical protein